MADTMSASRAMWTMFDPVHDATYFAPEALRAFTGRSSTLRGYWRGYFAGRAAPLGKRAGGRGYRLRSSNFANRPLVARAIPGVWDLITPQEAISRCGEVGAGSVVAAAAERPGGRGG